LCSQVAILFFSVLSLFNQCCSLGPSLYPEISFCGKRSLITIKPFLFALAIFLNFFFFSFANIIACIIFIDFTKLLFFLPLSLLTSLLLVLPLLSFDLLTLNIFLVI